MFEPAEWTEFSLADPEQVRQAVEAITGHQAEWSARIESVQAYPVETRGLFGRRRTEEVHFGAEIVHWYMTSDEGTYQVSVQHPVDWPPLAGGTPTPEGATVVVTDPDLFTLDLHPGRSAAEATREICAVLALTFPDAPGPAWRIGVVDNT
jgi:hypothetical protein